MHAPDLFRHVRSRYEHTAFVVDSDQPMTWRELDDRSQRFAYELRSHGVERGDRVASFLGTSTDLVVAFLGALRAGAVWVPVNDKYGPVEISHILSDSGAVLALVEEGSDAAAVVAGLESSPSTLTLEAIRASYSGTHSIDEEPGPDDPVLFIYTSGTTGQSKGVVHTTSSLCVAIDSLTRLWRWTSEDRLVLALPLFHVHGFGIGVVGTLLCGNECRMLRRFDPRRALVTISRGGTIFMGVPTMYARLLECLDEYPGLAGSLESARLFTSGSDALPAENFRRFETLTGHRILERYGMSETLLTVSNPYENELRRPGAIGFPVPGMQARIVDDDGESCPAGIVGNLHVRGPFVMREYWEQPEKTAESFDGDWFITGDVAYFDQDGYIHHAGRKSVDIIKSGGFKISAKEIEAVLRTHAAVEQVAVLGLPDPEWGQVIAAAIVPASELGVVGDELIAMLGDLVVEQLADYKRPRVWAFIDALPRNALGKVQKRKLESEFE